MIRHKIKLEREFSKVLFTADQHLFHSRLLEKGNCRRAEALRPQEGESLIDCMNRTVVQQWNEAVKAAGPGSVVFCLGDLSFHNNSASRELIAGMGGDTKYLIRGNHDSKLPAGWSAGYDGFVDLEIKEPSSGRVLLITASHYPMAAWKESHYGTWCLHGHCHGRLQVECEGRFDVGVETSIERVLPRPLPFAPYSLVELLAIMGEPRYWFQGNEPRGHHHG